MEIKKLHLKNRVFLAPMLEPNDIAFRLLCKKAGCGLTYTGMINPLSKKKLCLDDKPALQFFCNSTKGLKEFIKKYDKKVSLWDFNLGCPSKLSKKLGHGVFLHKDLEVIQDILKTARGLTKKPLTIKLRKSKYVKKILKIAEKYCDAVGIHARTQKQGYSGKPDLKFAEGVKKKTFLPIIYSGDVNEKNAFDLLKKFDYVMVGRGAIGNPDIFAKLSGKKLKKEFGFLDYLKFARKYGLPFRQIKYQAMNFTKGLQNSKGLRRKIVLVKSLEEIEGFFN